MLSGILLDRGSSGGTANFRAVYYGARCILNRADPYQPNEFLRIYRAESGEFPSNPGKKLLFLRAVPICVNLPTTLFLVVPLAMLPWGSAHVLWLFLIAACLTTAGLMAFDLAKDYAPKLSLLLICILQANSEVLFAVGNTAGIAVSLCVVAVWCFVRKRYEWLGVVSLAVSLALKPHDSGLVWLYLLLAGGALRRRSLQTLAVVFVLAVPAILWVGHVSPDWMQELRSNLATTASRGDISDPGPMGRKGSADVIIDLQTVVSVFNDSPGFYNPVVYAVCGSLLILLGTVIWRAGRPAANTWYALAAISALSMLATYHRPYDAKLLLLAIPACAMLWAQGGSLRWVAFSITGLAVILTGDIPLAILTLHTSKMDFLAMSTGAKLLSIPLLRPAPLILLASTVFYLWVFLKGNSRRVELPMASIPKEDHRAPFAQESEKMWSNR